MIAGECNRIVLFLVASNICSSVSYGISENILTKERERKENCFSLINQRNE
jgi:hypothetical protein